MYTLYNITRACMMYKGEWDQGAPTNHHNTNESFARTCKCDLRSHLNQSQMSQNFKIFPRGTCLHISLSMLRHAIP